MAESEIQVEVLIIGAGVVGLAIAAELSPMGRVLVVEQHGKFGQETSSRNSEVIHSGIYYPAGSQKTRFCIRGRERLYPYCVERQIGHRQCGKLVVATTTEEAAYLERLAEHCESEIVPFHRVPKSWLERKEPDINGESALFFPLTGIIDSHAFMQSLERRALENGVNFAYRHQVKSIQRNGKWRVELQTPDGRMAISATRAINAAGLGAAELSNQALGTNRYQHRYCRGRYFTLDSSYQNRFRCLIYPVPPKDGLGVHVTLDLEGHARLGPDVDWCADATHSESVAFYECDWEALRLSFYQSASRLIRGLEASRLQPGLIGIRPKLFVDGKAHSDFLVEDKAGFIHCLGIESPGLTASLAIAEEIRKWIEN